LRRAVITQLICNFYLDFSVIESEYNIDFNQYFLYELAELDKMQADGLLVYSDKRIEILPAGKLLVRNICMTFDAYLRENKEQRFSKVI